VKGKDERTADEWRELRVRCADSVLELAIELLEQETQASAGIARDDLLMALLRNHRSEAFREGRGYAQGDDKAERIHDDGRRDEWHNMLTRFLSSED
jgi:hypothetical protein